MFNKMTKNVLNISALDNRPVMSAEELKATFDRAGVDIKEAFNGLVEQLASETAGEHIGANVESVATKTLQAVLTAFDEAIANRYTKNEVDTEVLQETNNLVEDFDINLTTGVLTITKKDGTVETFDTALEKVPAKFEIVEENEVYYLKITNTDGTSTKVNVNTLFNEYLFTSSDEISFEVINEGNSKKVVAKLRDNSIGIGKLSLNVVSQLEEYVQSASSFADSAKVSADIATQKASEAKSDAMLAKSYAVGGTGTRENEDSDNAKFYKEHLEAKAIEIEENEKRIDRIENIQDTAKATGENVYFDNAKNYPLMSLKGEGKSIQEAEPSPDAPQEIKTISEASYRGCGKNFYNVNDIKMSDKYFTIDEDGWLTVTYDNSAGTGVKYLNHRINASKVLKENTNYTFVTEIKNVTNFDGALYISQYSSTNQFKGNDVKYEIPDLSNGVIKIENRLTKEDFNDISVMLGTFVGFRAGASGTITFRISVIEDTTITTENFVYEPYHESTLPIDLKGNELASVGTVSDKILIDRKGNVVVEKNVGKRIFTGAEEENWVLNSSTLNNFEMVLKSVPLYKNDSVSRIISNTFLGVMWNDSWTKNNSITIGGGSNIFVRTDKYNTIEDFKAFLSEQNLIIYYVLKNPQLISLGTISNPEIFKGINNIVVETNLGNMNIEVEYVEDLQLRIENLEENTPGGGGSGGTTDYTALSNKPKINGIELTGNKTSEELGITGGGGNILTFSNIIVETTAWVEDTTYEEFGYRAEVQCVGVTEEFFSDVAFDVPEALSGNYAPISLTGAGTVTIYAAEQPESIIIIPTIICMKGA